MCCFRYDCVFTPAAYRTVTNSLSPTLITCGQELGAFQGRGNQLHEFRIDRQMLKVTHYLRKSRIASNYSIENVFSSVRDLLKDRVCFDVINAPCYSNAILPRARIVGHVYGLHPSVLHVTGDINFAAIGGPAGRTILTIHDCSYMSRTFGIKRALLRLFWLQIPIAKSAVITTVSQAAKVELLSHVKIDDSKVRVIYNPFQSDFAVQESKERRDIPIILSVGTAANKNLERCLESLHGISCEYHIIGRVPVSLRKKATALGINLKLFEGLTREEVYSKYCECDLLLFPSTIEGFGIPIIEAQSVGRPVVTSNLSSMPEIAGDAAFYVDPFDISSIRNGITRVLYDMKLNKDLVGKGLNNIKRFDPYLIANQYFDLYQSIK